MIDSISSLASRLPVSQVQGGSSFGPSAAAGMSGADFGSVMSKLAADSVQTLKSAESVSLSGLQGKAPVQQVVEAVLAAEQTLQTAIAIRDKAVSAYLEISRMAI